MHALLSGIYTNIIIEFLSAHIEIRSVISNNIGHASVFIQKGIHSSTTSVVELGKYRSKKLCISYRSTMCYMPPGTRTRFPGCCKTRLIVVKFRANFQKPYCWTKGIYIFNFLSNACGYFIRTLKSSIGAIDTECTPKKSITARKNICETFVLSCWYFGALVCSVYTGNP